jgi:hypothetical protein
MNVSSRWCVTAVFALGALACSDPVPPPAQGAFLARVQPASPQPQGKSCPTSSVTFDVPVVWDNKPAEALTDRTYLHKIVDGESGASVECTVKGSSTFTFNASFRLGDRGFRLTEGTLGADKKGTAKGTVIKTGVPGFPTMSSPTANCTIDASAVPGSGSNLQVKAGSLWATFNCPNVENPPTNSCQTNGFVILENCNQ